MKMLPLDTKKELVTRKWWFFPGLVLIAFIVPPYASKGYLFPGESLEVALEGMGNPVCSFFEYRAVFKAVPVVLIAALIIAPIRVGRFFNFFVAIHYLFFALYSGVGNTEKYGLVINPGNLIMFLAVSACWFLEVFVGRNDFNCRKQSFWRYWFVPLVLFAFWFPVNPQSLMPDFDLGYLFTNGAGRAFCMMTPLYIGVLAIYYPSINTVTLRVTSIVGLCAAFVNLHVEFILYPGKMWWVGVLHLPLLIISLYGLILSLKVRPQSMGRQGN